MEGLKRYKRKDNTPIVAVQMALKFTELVYELWDGVQRAKPGDWLVFSPSVSHNPTYTIDGDSFAATYEPVEGVHGHYRKQAVWAKQATRDGAIPTKEGETAYRAGHYLCFNNADGTDGYATSPETFEKLYELAE
jgi:hypothetical protein